MRYTLLFLWLATSFVRGEEWCCSEPLRKLPHHIQYESGRLSLVADIAHQDENGRVPVYLINDSHDALSLAVQDGDPYLKLETRDAQGQWVRAQGHMYSWCGNSYYDLKVPRGRYYEFKGASFSEGEEADVRYAMYNQSVALTTQAFRGRVVAEEVRKATFDLLAVESGDFYLVCRAAMGDFPEGELSDSPQELQERGIWILGSGKFDRKATLEVLDEVALTFPEMAGEVRYARDRLEGEPLHSDCETESFHRFFISDRLQIAWIAGIVCLLVILGGVRILNLRKS